MKHFADNKTDIDAMNGARPRREKTHGGLIEVDEHESDQCNQTLFTNNKN